jgi:hypothetical protein
MKNDAVGMLCNSTTFTPHFVKIGSFVQKLKGKTHTHTQNGEPISLLLPFREGKWEKKNSGVTGIRSYDPLFTSPTR